MTETDTMPQENALHKVSLNSQDTEHSHKDPHAFDGDKAIADLGRGDRLKV